MRLRHIEIFYAVYATGSISNAARMLNVSQPTVSQTLRHAEDQLGYNLFHRIKGRLIPSNEAMALFEETREIYKMIGSLRKKATNLHRDLDGRIRLACVPAIGLQALPKAISEYCKERPGVDFDVQIYNQAELFNALRTQEKDVGLAFDPPQLAGFTQLPLAEVEIVCIYSRGEFDKYPARIRLADLEDHVSINVDESGPVGERVSAELDAIELRLNSSITSQNLYMARNLVGQGAGIAVVDEFTARSLGIGKVSFKGFVEPLKVQVHAVHLENKQLSKTCHKFLKYAAKNHLITSFMATSPIETSNAGPKRVF